MRTCDWFYSHTSCNDSDGKETGYELADWGPFSDRVEELPLSHSVQIGSAPTQSHTNENRGLFRREQSSRPPSTGFKNVSSFTSTSLVHLHGLLLKYRGKSAVLSEHSLDKTQKSHDTSQYIPRPSECL